MAVLSGNRNFEGRIHPLARASYLASPPLVVAFALAGRIDIDLTSEPLGHRSDGEPVYLRRAVADRARRSPTVVAEQVRSEIFTRNYASVFDGDERWRALPVPDGDRYAWDPDEHLRALPPFFDGHRRRAGAAAGHRGRAGAGHARRQRDHRPHLARRHRSRAPRPAGAWLIGARRRAARLQQYGARRGHHEVMMRGTFANIRLRNLLAPTRRATSPSTCPAASG